MLFRYLLVLALVVGLTLAQQDTVAGDTDDDRMDCGPCDKSACPSDLSCRAGLVPDPCSCCQICAKVLGERCGGTDWTDGYCADEYICAGKSVYEPVQDGRVGQCVCKNFKSVCGTDGVVYKNECELKMASYDRPKGHPSIDVDETDKLCMTAPVITVGPQDSQMQPGSKSELSCEAEGRPIPNIIWTKDGEELPGNHLNIATRKRNGPSKFALTSWVLISVTQVDGGLYTCTASNSQGQVEATATVTVSAGKKEREDLPNEIKL